METKNEPIPKEIVAATAAEPSDELSAWLKVTADYSVNNICLEQQCMLCENTRILGGYHHSVPWICNECKDAIAYVKEIMKHRGTEIFYD